MRVSSLEKQDDNCLNSCDYTPGREGEGRGGWKVVLLYMAYTGMYSLKAIPFSQAF